MNLSSVKWAVLLGLAALAGGWAFGPRDSPGVSGTTRKSTAPIVRRTETESARPPVAQRIELESARLPAATRDTDRSTAERRAQTLEARLAEQVERTAALEARVAELSREVEQLASRGPAADRAESEIPTAGTATAAAPPAVPPAPPAREVVDYSKSRVQRALEAAGLDEDTAESIKLRNDRLAMTEMYLRDQATREGWLDTERFREEMAAVDSQRTSIRDELGDDGYDRYLFSLGQTNRVIVQDVMLESVAESVGLKTGDLIVRYGDTRVFQPDELVAQTRQGAIGDGTTIEVIRNRERFEIDVPRGPLGVRIGRAQDDPDALRLD